MLGIPQLSGSNPAAAKARAIQRDLAAKAASRRYDQYCQQQGIGPAEASLLAPALVKKGNSLRRIEAKHQRQDQIKAKKDQLKRRFGRTNQTPRF